MKALRVSEAQVKELRAAYALLGSLLAVAEEGGGRVPERKKEAPVATGIGYNRFLQALRVGTTKVPEETAAPGSYYAQVARTVGAAAVTEEQATLVGRWLEAQGWLKGPVPTRQVASKWPEWLMKARAWDEEGERLDVPETARWKEL